MCKGWEAGKREVTFHFQHVGFEVPMGHPGRDVQWQLNMWVWNLGGRCLS